MPDDNPVVVERKAGWAEVVLNRPERRNSVIVPLTEKLIETLDELGMDDGVASVIIRGEGGYFCSGLDLKALQADPPPEWAVRQGPSWRELHLRLFNFTKPVIGAFESYGINAGSALALACDILVAGESAFLQVGEIQQGNAAPMNVAWLKTKVPEQVAARLILMGDRVPAPELVRLGLAAECVPDDMVVSRCREIAERLASFPPEATSRVKRSLIKQRGIEDPQSFFPELGKGGGRGPLAMVKE